LALTISNHSTARGFVVLAVVLLVVSVGRLTDVAFSGVSAPSTRAIAAYGSADTKAYVGDSAGAAHLLQTAVHISPDYEQAWEQLANDEYSEGTRTGYSAFERDLGRALALHPSSTQKAVLFTDLGFTQLLDGQFEAAGVTLHHALTFDPTNEVALANLSLQRMLVGDRAGADMYFNMALAHVASHGPYFREQYFAGYRHGQQTFDQVGIRNPVFDAFYMWMKEAEASLDALGQPAPGDSHGASVSHVVLRPVSGPGGQSLATVAFDYRGFQVGDHLSVRWYSQGTYYDVAESLPDFKLDASFAGSGTLLPDNMGVPTLPGSHTVEIYLNGVLLGSSTFTMPTPGA
jgi:tetratricopeptide (TPR) repeat protein